MKEWIRQRFVVGKEHRLYNMHIHWEKHDYSLSSFINDISLYGTDEIRIQRGKIEYQKLI